MTRKPRDYLRSLARHLRKVCPPPQAVRVRRAKLDDHTAGESIPGLIRISNVLDRQMQLDTLVHEWAHQLAPAVRKDHSQEFWLAHGRTYEAFTAWLDLWQDLPD